MYRAMIVDDDKWAIEDIRKSFRFHDWGFEVVGEYNNAEDALAMILRAPPDLVISDIRMSKNSGLDMARICREQGVRTLFVIVSGYDSFSYVQDAFRYGVFFYLLKPIEDGQVCELMQRIRGAAGRARTARGEGLHERQLRQGAHLHRRQLYGAHYAGERRKRTVHQ